MCSYSELLSSSKLPSSSKNKSIERNPIKVVWAVAAPAELQRRIVTARQARSSNSIYSEGLWVLLESEELDSESDS
jgi:hypothetical protein